MAQNDKRGLLAGLAAKCVTVCNKVLYGDYWTSKVQPLVLLRCGIAQKVLGVNRHVPWPVHFTSQIKGVERIQRGTNRPGFAMGCYIDGRNGVIVEDNVWIGPRVSIISMNHELGDYTQYVETDPIVIGRDSWLATNCVILSGVRLGPHTVVAAGAVVTKSFEEGNQVLGGNPAKSIKRLGAYEGPRT